MVVKPSPTLLMRFPGACLLYQVHIDETNGSGLYVYTARIRLITTATTQPTGLNYVSEKEKKLKRQLD